MLRVDQNSYILVQIKDRKQKLFKFAVHGNCLTIIQKQFNIKDSNINIAFMKACATMRLR